MKTKKGLVLHAMQKTAEENSCRKSDAKYLLESAQCLEEQARLKKEMADRANKNIQAMLEMVEDFTGSYFTKNE